MDGPAEVSEGPKIPKFNSTDFLQMAVARYEQEKVKYEGTERKKSMKNARGYAQIVGGREVWFSQVQIKIMSDSSAFQTLELHYH